MAITGFSKKFDRELDAVQYLTLLGYDLERDPDLRVVDQSLRTSIKEDIICPSCGAKDAVLVSGAKNKIQTKNVKQPHFRFISDEGVDAHDIFCDLREDKKFKDISADKVSFSSSRSNATRIISHYVSKAISNKFIERADLVNLRAWHIKIKKENMVSLKLKHDQIYHYAVIFVRKNKVSEDFRPKMGELKGLDWNRFALDRIAVKNSGLSKQIFSHNSTYVHDRELEKIVIKNQLFFDVRVIAKKYEILSELKSFINRYLNYQFKTKHEISFLDAFSALLLFVNNWGYDDALSMFIDIVNSPEIVGLELDNIVGLNPFKDFKRIETILNMNEVAEMLLPRSDLTLEIEAEIQALKSEYEQWKS